MKDTYFKSFKTLCMCCVPKDINESEHKHMFLYKII